MQKKGGKRALCVWHRRAGKDLTALNWTVVASQLRVGAYYHFLPTYSQGRKIIWDGMDERGVRFLDYWPKELVLARNETEMQLTLANGSLWQVIGTENPDRVVGTNPVGCVFSEYSLQNPQAWEYIRPILAENNGWAVFLYTPRGRNHAWQLHQLAEKSEDWFTEVLTVENTGALRLEAIEAERTSGMSDEMVQQEFFCSYNAPMFGAYYGVALDQVRQQGRICKVPYDPALATHTFWDLGIEDYTAIWFVQFAGVEKHIVDYYEMSGEGLAHYARVLRDKEKEHNLVWGEHWAPHDIVARELGSGMSRLETARELGVNFRIVKLGSYERRGGGLLITEGIEAGRNLLSSCWFDEERCFLGLSRLSNYRKEWNDKHQCFHDRPFRDINTHGADAFRTFAMALKLGAGGRKIETGTDKYDRHKSLVAQASEWAA